MPATTPTQMAKLEELRQQYAILLANVKKSLNEDFSDSIIHQAPLDKSITRALEEANMINDGIYDEACLENSLYELRLEHYWHVYRMRERYANRTAEEKAIDAKTAADKEQAIKWQKEVERVNVAVADAVTKMQKKNELELKKAVEVKTTELQETMEADMQKKFEMLTIEMEKKFETLTKEKNIVIDNEIDLENETSASDGEQDSVSSESDWEEVSAAEVEDK